MKEQVEWKDSNVGMEQRAQTRQDFLFVPFRTIRGERKEGDTMLADSDEEDWM